MIVVQFLLVVDINRIFQLEFVDSFRLLFKVENFCNFKEGFVEFYFKFIVVIILLVYI